MKVFENIQKAKYDNLTYFQDFATEITIHNAREHQMNTEHAISNEHITNNKAVRDTLVSRGIVPEELSPEEDVKKVERKLRSDEKKS